MIHHKLMVSSQRDSRDDVIRQTKTPLNFSSNRPMHLSPLIPSFPPNSGVDWALTSLWNVRSTCAIWLSLTSTVYQFNKLGKGQTINGGKIHPTQVRTTSSHQPHKWAKEWHWIYPIDEHFWVYCSCSAPIPSFSETCETTPRNLHHRRWSVQ